MSFSDEERSKIITDQRFNGSVVSCDSEDVSTGDMGECSVGVPLDFRKEHPLDMEMEFIECLQMSTTLHDDEPLKVFASMDWEADSLYFQSRTVTTEVVTQKTDPLQVDQSIPSSHGSATIPNSIPACG
eukprot:15344652-Ditylum_brightwellii.AAC.1